MSTSFFLIMEKYIIQAQNLRLALENFNRKKSFWGKHLGGACGVASYFLSLKIPNSKLIMGDFIKNTNSFEYGLSHCWVLYKDLILDITATQFGINDKIFLTHCSNRRYQSFREVKPKNLADVLDAFAGWDFTQNPINFKAVNRSNRIVINYLQPL